MRQVIVRIFGLLLNVLHWDLKWQNKGLSGKNERITTQIKLVYARDCLEGYAEESASLILFLFSVNKF